MDHLQYTDSHINQLKRSTRSSRLGQIGERVAEKYLLNKGFEILDRNFHTRHAEIDIIACKNNRLYFVEVKTTMNSAVPLIDKVNKRKFYRIYFAGIIWQRKKGIHSFIGIDLLLMHIKRLRNNKFNVVNCIKVGV